MRITAARPIVTCPGRNFVTLKIATDQGVCSIGDATHNGRERQTPATDEVFPHDNRFDRGELVCGDTPVRRGDIDEALAAKYPYKPAYLPVVRLEDGTMWNW